MKQNIFLIISLSFLLIFSTSCVDDLNQNPTDPDLFTEVDVYSSPEQALGALAKVYAGLALTGQQGPAGQPDIDGSIIDEGFSQYTRIMWNLNEATTDHGVIGWLSDPGVPEINQLSWDANNPWTKGMYYRMAQNISFANSFIENAADAEINGVEGDFVLYTNVDGLSIAGAFSFLDTKITKSLVPTNDVVVGSPLAFAPEKQGNIRIRQEFGMSGGNVGHMQAQYVFSGDSVSDIMAPNSAVQDSYSYIDLRAGISAEDWMAELYVDNVTDKRAEISNTFVFDRQRVAVNRPTTIGIRVKRNF